MTAPAGRPQKRAEQKIHELIERLSALTRDRDAAIRDQLNPMSKTFPSRKEGHDDQAALLTREIEVVRDDLSILRAVAAGALDLRKERKFRKALPKCVKELDAANSRVAYLRGTLAQMERAKKILK